MRDIETREDIEQLIHSFYSELLQIEDMKPVFAGIHFEDHVPQIVHFWSFVLLDEAGYKTNVFEKHRHLPIQLHQFDTWLSIFSAAVDRLFAGEKAELAKQRATVLTHTFKSKWAQIRP